MKFWDTSALVPLLIDEPQSETCLSLLANEESFGYWWGTPVEIDSSIARRVREGSLSPSEAAQVRRNAERLFDAGSEVPCSEKVRISACHLLRLHPLRSVDALQLAAALQTAEGKFDNLQFVSLDNRLREAAMAEGATVLPTPASEAEPTETASPESP